MKLSEVKSALDDSRVLYFREVDLFGVTHDSREAGPGMVFVALAGQHQDGHQFVGEAIRRGVSAVVLGHKVSRLPPEVPQVIVGDTRQALSRLSARLPRNPSESLCVIGVTGTNGKSTTSCLLRHILHQAGRSAGLIGTISYQVGPEDLPSEMTTPDAPRLHHLLSEMLAAGSTHAVMEVSSHALDQKRVDDVAFNVGVFTNLARFEHLDYHRDFEAYRRAKSRLFALLPPSGTAVLNADDPSSALMRSACSASVLSYGLRRPADVTAHVQTMGLGGTRFHLSTPAGEKDIFSPLVGEHNVANSLAAAAAALALGLSLDEIGAGLESLASIPGRLEAIDAGQPFTVLVDYAHTADALECVLSALQQVASQRLLLVFGCGGERDRSKRPQMGLVAERYADLFFLTADNSRSEPTDQIIHEIECGLSARADYRVFPDRRRAIREAFRLAQPDDVVLIAGKGHETTQSLPEGTIPFDDRTEARRALRDLVGPATAATPEASERPREQKATA